MQRSKRSCFFPWLLFLCWAFYFSIQPGCDGVDFNFRCDAECTGNGRELCGGKAVGSGNEDIKWFELKVIVQNQ